MKTTALEFPLEQEIKEFLLSFREPQEIFRTREEIESQFFHMIIRLFRWQYRNNEPYRNFCVHHGISEDTKIEYIHQIPAVPVELFRDVNFCSFPLQYVQRVFRTSGTTTGRRGEHKLFDTEIYDLGSVIQMQRIIGNVPSIGVSLVSDAEDSSLGHMARFFAPNMKQGFQASGIQHDLVWEFLDSAKEPVYIPATGFAMASLLSKRETPCELPTGSVIMVTGGFKGKRVQISEVDLQDKLYRIFPNTRIVAEYGMTELSSQLWSTEIGKPFHPPPWMHVCTVDPNTGSPVSGLGLLRFYDLANHQTVLAIETKDLGAIQEDGSVILYGRIPSSRPRGCSIRVEEGDPFFRKNNMVKRSPPHCIPIDMSKLAERSKVTIEVLHEMNTILFEKNIDGSAKKMFYEEEGMTRKSAQYYYLKCIELFDQKKICMELSTYTFHPPKIGIILARGVFVAGLEWLYLCICSGAEVLIKPPRGNFSFYEQLTRSLKEKGIQISCTLDHNDLHNMDSIIAFGSNDSLSNITQQYSSSYICGFGEKLSIAFCDDVDLVSHLARDVFAYATKGCMSPAAIFTQNRNLASRLCEELENLVSEFGFVSEMDGDERRYRSSVAALTGKVHNYSAGSVFEYTLETFFTTALPYSPNVYCIDSLDEVYKILQQYHGKISTIGWGLSESHQDICSMAHRVCNLGSMQTPPFPRKHDGKMMWKSICGQD